MTNRYDDIRRYILQKNDDPRSRSAMLWVYCNLALKLILVIYG